jgi:hypothetical protein
MNNLYFACCDCKIYIETGYRWASWQLEDAGIVSRNENVHVDAVLATARYWSPPRDDDSRWLYEEILPPVHQFLNAHRSHRVVFGTSEDFAPATDDYDFEWMQTGYLPEPTVRYLFEMLSLKSWHEVAEYMDAKEIQPGWWQDTWSGNPTPREKGRKKFEELVSARHGS